MPAGPAWGASRPGHGAGRQWAAPDGPLRLVPREARWGELVRSTPGSRTAWHRHAVGQALHITGGVGLVQPRGGEVIVMLVGDTVYTPPGEWYWRCAAPDNFMSHRARWRRRGAGNGTGWGDQVTGRNIRARPAEPPYRRPWWRRSAWPCSFR